MLGRVAGVKGVSRLACYRPLPERLPGSAGLVVGAGVAEGLLAVGCLAAFAWSPFPVVLPRVGQSLLQAGPPDLTARRDGRRAAGLGGVGGAVPGFPPPGGPGPGGGRPPPGAAPPNLTAGRDGQGQPD